jgi:FkbM family methyltransferase
MRLYVDSILSQNLFCDDFERQERLFLNRFLRPRDVFMDVGANIGLFTLLAARRVGIKGHVYAFEPCLETHRRLLDNVSLNRFENVSCYPLALSDRAAVLQMKRSLDGYDAWNSLGQPTMGSSFAVEDVSAVSLDDFLQERDLVGRVTMIKVDVEGWETRVLAGGVAALARTDAPTLQVEFTEQAARSAGSSCKELYHLLEELGYGMFRYEPVSNRLVRDPLRPSYPYLNLVATKQPGTVDARLSRHRRWHW